MFRSLLISAVFALLFFPAALPAEILEDPEIGVILPLTGIRSEVGNAVRKGIQLAMEKLGSDMQGRLRVHFEDDQSKPVATLAAYRKLRREYKVGVVYAVGSAAGSVLASPAEEDEVALLLLSTNKSVVSGRMNVNLLWPSVDTLAQAMVDECLKRGYRKVGMVSATQESRLLLAEAFERLSKGRIRITLRAEVPQHELDLRSLAARIKATCNCDAVFDNLYLGQLGSLARQARELKFEKPFFASEYFGIAGEIEAARGALCGQWYVDILPPPEFFTADYKARFGQEPEYGSTSGYDFVQVLVNAQRNSYAGRTFSERLRMVKEINGALGSYSALGDGTFGIPAAVRTVHCSGD